MTYRNAQSKEEKWEMEKLIEQIKKDFESEIALNDKRVLRLNRLKGELTTLTTQTSIFDKTKAEKARWEKEVKKLSAAIQKLETELEEIRSNKIYENAFEWRFEFPEVLNDDGDFTGFDVVIGNPPYGRYLELDNSFKNYLKSRGLDGSTGDIAENFIKLVSSGLLKEKYNFSFIIPKGLSYVKSWQNIRELLLNKIYIHEAIDTSRAFPEAAYEMMILISNYLKPEFITTGFLSESNFVKINIPFKYYNKDIFIFGFPPGSLSILEKIRENCVYASEYYNYWYGKGGMTPKVNILSTGTKVLTGKEIQKYFIKDIDNKWFLEDKYLTADDKIKAKVEKVVVQDIVAHITNPRPHIKLTATIDYNSNFCLNTVMCFSKKSSYSNEFLLGLINSKFMSFYYYYFIFNQAIRTMHFMPGYSDILPIPKNVIFHV